MSRPTSSRTRGSSKDRMATGSGRSHGAPPIKYPVTAQPAHLSPPSTSSVRGTARTTRTLAYNGKKTAGDATEDMADLSDLRKLLQLAFELDSIDVNSALAVYKKLMKKTGNTELMEREETYLEQRQEHMERLTSGRGKRGDDELARQIQDLVDQNEKLKSEYDDLARKYEESKSSPRRADRLIKEKEELEKKLQTKDESLRKLKAEKDEVLNRLSKEMGAKLNDNNSAIVDLSDPNRAMKLGEKYNELYDNEWTDAMEKYSDNGYMEEEAIVKRLYIILMNCYEICEKLAKDQMMTLKTTLLNPGQQARRSWVDGTDSKFSRSANRLLKDCRKVMAPDAVDNIFEEQARGKFGDACKEIPHFVKKCIELCWLMCVQDPPVVLGKTADPGDTFDTNMYKPYTNTGTMVAYVVWPPLLLHKGGPLLVKGVVQPIKIERRTDKYSTRKARETDTTSGKPKTNFGKTVSPSTNNQFTRPGAYDLDSWNTRAPVDRPITVPVKKEYIADTNRYSTQYNYGRPYTADTSEYQHNRYHQNTPTWDSNPPDSRNYEQFSVLQTQPEYEYKVVMYKGVKHAQYKGKLYELDIFKRVMGISGESCA